MERGATGPVDVMMRYSRLATTLKIAAGERNLIDGGWGYGHVFFRRRGFCGFLEVREFPSLFVNVIEPTARQERDRGHRTDIESAADRFRHPCTQRLEGRCKLVRAETHWIKGSLHIKGPPHFRPFCIGTNFLVLNDGPEWSEPFLPIPPTQAPMVILLPGDVGREWQLSSVFMEKFGKNLCW